MGLTRIWLTGLIRNRTGQMAATIAAIGITVALLATLAGFFDATESSMTRKAIADVPVDWQVQLASGTQLSDATTALSQQPGYASVAEVGYFHTPGFQSTTGSTVQSTGAGFVLGVPPAYEQTFPGEVRRLLGQGKTVLAQQTAANLNASIGTPVSITRPGLDPVQVTIDGVIDLPYADSLFQVVGAPVGAPPQAPPDNVLVMPIDQWHALFDPVSTTAPDALVTQLHVALNASGLPNSPTNAFNAITRIAHNFESRMAGGAVVGNNLGARLDAARADALYARVLFLFLGLPGVMLSILLTAVVVMIARPRRLRDQALLRLRGCSLRQVIALSTAEALFLGVAGSLIGIVAAGVILDMTYGSRETSSGLGSVIQWLGLAILVGIVTAVATMVLPSWRNFRVTSVTHSRSVIQREPRPVWEWLGLDFLALALAIVIYWQAGRSGYQVVLVPEGLATVSVSYTTFFAPLFLWVGASLLMMRITRLLLGHRGRLLIPLFRGFSGQLAPLVSSSLSLQRTRVTTGMVLIVIAIAFAVSTSIFNMTYQHQAVVDAELSNGADVTLTGNAATNLASLQPAIGQVEGVANVEAMQHRFAYVGTDLQDMYGIDPSTLSLTARLSDTYFVGDSAKTVLKRLAATPDGVLISPETVTDFQLHVGDPINLRLQDARDQQYQIVPFHVVGVAREFPTAPSDSFLVANSPYIATVTTSSSVETLLVKTSASPASVAERIRREIGPAPGVTLRDITEQRHIINSGLTSISLRGLTRVELSFAVLMSAAGAGLMLFVGLDYVQRTVAISKALGATPRQLGSFVWSEAGLLAIGGIVGGVGLGWMIAAMLSKLLTGVFDPPPAALSVPWLYILVVLVVTSTAIGLAGRLAIASSQKRILETIRRF